MEHQTIEESSKVLIFDLCYSLVYICKHTCKINFMLQEVFILWVKENFNLKISLITIVMLMLLHDIHNMLLFLYIQCCSWDYIISVVSSCNWRSIVLTLCSCYFWYHVLLFILFPLAIYCYWSQIV